MFDQLKNLSQLPGMLAKAKEAQAKIQQMQAELAAKRVSGEAGAGMVEATVNGELELVNLRIDAERLGTGDLGGPDVELLQDLIVAAVTAAQGKAQAMIRDEMASLAGEAGLPREMLDQMPDV
ncbi:MAG: YbaB/EbfC family nucleoid-associated protein [Planctomycetota bacterium]